jgi:hypothetical protein
VDEKLPNGILTPNDAARKNPFGCGCFFISFFCACSVAESKAVISKMNSLFFIAQINNFQLSFPDDNKGAF